MTKLYLDETNIKNLIVPSLNDAIKYLSTAIEECQKMTIPDDFEFNNYLKQLTNKNWDTMVDIIKKRDTLKNSQNDYKKVELSNGNEFSKIATLNIAARKNMIEK